MQPISPIPSSDGGSMELPRRRGGDPSPFQRRATDAPFPSKLYDMLEYAEQMGLSNVVSWLPHGMAFKIHDKNKFMSDVANLFFRATKLRSVHRQLNLWGFIRIPAGEERDSWSHPCFLRAQPGEMCKMIRTKVKGKTSQEAKLDMANFPQLPSSQPSSTITDSENTFLDELGDELGDDLESILNKEGGPQALRSLLMRPRRVSVSSPPSSPGDYLSSPLKKNTTRPKFVTSFAATRRSSAPPAIKLARRDRFRGDAARASTAEVASGPTTSRLKIEPMTLPFGSVGSSTDPTSLDEFVIDEFSLFIDRMIQDPNPIDQMIPDPF